MKFLMIKLFLKKLRNITVGDFRNEILSEIIVEIILKYYKKTLDATWY